MFQCIKKIFHLGGPVGSHICLLFCVISLFVDPLFFFVPTIDYDENCIVFDKNFAADVLILRVISDLYVSLQLRIHLTRHDALTIGWLSLSYYSADILGFLPLSPVVLNYMFTTADLSNLASSMRLLSYFIVFQSLPRIIRVYPLFMKAARTLDD